MKDRWLLFFILGYICIMFKEKMFLVAIFVCILWIYKYRDKSVMLLILFIFALSICDSRNYTMINADNFVQGRVTDVKENYVVIQNNKTKTIVYNCNNCVYDSVIRVDGKIKPIPASLSTYGFNSKKWAEQKGASVSIYANKILLISKTQSWRGFVQSQINSIDNNSIKQFLNKMIFNINESDDVYYAMISSLGFTYLGFLMIFRTILSYIFTEKVSSIAEVLVIILLCCFYQFTFLTTRILISFILRFSSLSRKDRAGILGIICSLLYYDSLLTMSFIIPFAFRFISVLEFQYRKIINTFIIAVIQGIFLSNVNVILLFFYRYLMKFFGLFYFLSFMQLVYPMLRIDIMFNNLLHFIEPIFKLNLYGNPLGCGITLYIIMCMFVKNELFMVLLYFCFILFGWFHPFAEVTFINVNQGDSILVRLPFNSYNILIDTGQESSYDQVKSLLKAKSIYEIDAIYISHSDSDHSGNMKKLNEDFIIHEIKEGHDVAIENEKVVFHDINDFISKDTNDSSQVLYFMINGVRFLMTGDISSRIEKELIKKYDNLNIDILKVSHHGSNTSTSQDWLNKTNPVLAIISSGINNRYGHPHQETLNALDKKQILTLNTQDDGDITIYFTRFFNFIHTSNRKIGIISTVIK